MTVRHGVPTKQKQTRSSNCLVDKMTTTEPTSDNRVNRRNQVKPLDPITMFAILQKSSHIIEKLSTLTCS